MKLVALAGGVGGAKLVQGLAALDVELSVVVNTGDDFDHWGLRICPDLDTITYTLSGLSDNERGWGLKGETWGALSAMRRLGGSGWFGLGDHDLATHLRRTEWLREGIGLSEVTRRITESLGVRTRLLPMSDADCPTIVNGIGFQTWLVGQRGPEVTSLETTPGAAAPGVQALLADADAIVLAPSNPYVSIDPILGCIELPSHVPVVGLSPIVGGVAVKGPLAHMIPSLAGVPASAQAIFDHYIDRGVNLVGMLIEDGDRITGPHQTAKTVMGGLDDRKRVAEAVLALL